MPAQTRHAVRVGAGGGAGQELRAQKHAPKTGVGIITKSVPSWCLYQCTTNTPPPRQNPQPLERALSKDLSIRKGRWLKLPLRLLIDSEHQQP